MWRVARLCGVAAGWRGGLQAVLGDAGGHGLGTAAVRRAARHQLWGGATYQEYIDNIVKYLK